MKMQLRAFAAVIVLLGIGSQAMAQSPGVLYSWSHSVGSGSGDNLEGWSGGGTNAPSLSNATDGILTVVESVAGGDWQVADSFNTAKESASADGFLGNFDFGGVDLLGLDTLEIDVSHNGTGDINGQVFLQPDPGTGCCGFLSSQFTASPGSNTITVDLNALGLSEADAKYVRSIGFQVYGHSEVSPLTWEFSEVRVGGTPLTERTIADHSLGLENAVVKFDDLAISGSTGSDTQGGLSTLDGALRWVDLGGTGDAGDESGGAVAWGNNNALAVDFLSRPLDISNYQFARVTMKATPGQGAADSVGVQFYAQYADRDANNAFGFGGTSLTLTADGEYHELLFPLDALGAGGDLDLTQWIGLNLDPHAGGALQIQVQSVVLIGIPEPTTLALLLGTCGATGLLRRRESLLG